MNESKRASRGGKSQMMLTKKQKKKLIRILVSLAMVIMLVILGGPIAGLVQGFGIAANSGDLAVRLVMLALYLIPYLVIGYDILLDAFHKILHGQAMDECFLMAVATVGALVLGVLGKGEFTEAVAVMLFYQVGTLAESIAVGKSRREIIGLLDIRPDIASVEKRDAEGNISVVEVDPSQVEVGSIIVVNPGVRVPIDGEVVSGHASLDTSAITGESVPRRVGVGDVVYSGSISQDGTLRIKTTREFSDSTVSRMFELVSDASSRKSRSEAFISKFAKIYTPIVVYLALALAVIPCALAVIGVAGVDRAEALSWVYRALTFLVISCPCALVVSVPMCFFAGIGSMSKRGILVKGSTYLEQLSFVRHVVMDKTGTLTRGVFEVVNEPSPELVLLASLIEKHSSHPIARSINRYADSLIESNPDLLNTPISLIGGLSYGDLAKLDSIDIQEQSGRGIVAKISSGLGSQAEAEYVIKIGNSRLIGNAVESTTLGSDRAAELGDATVVYVSVNDVFAGKIAISDIVKDTSAKAISLMRKAGVSHIEMLTGDNDKVAACVSQKLGLDGYRANLLPEQKVEALESILSSIADRGDEAKEKVLFAGDGINDAPVLARADVGLAMGALGSDAAVEAADVVIMDDNPLRIGEAILQASRIMSIVRQNIVFIILVKIICLVLGALGYASMWLAVFADIGVLVLAVLNSLRALK